VSLRRNNTQECPVLLVIGIHAHEYIR
jgi:hypothetical protein